MSSRRVIVVGGGAAGFFAAITCAEAAPEAEVTVLERGPQFLSKVRISGGGRCNVTHSCFDARELATRYPRGERALLALRKGFVAPAGHSHPQAPFARVVKHAPGSCGKQVGCQAVGTVELQLRLPGPHARLRHGRLYFSQAVPAGGLRGLFLPDTCLPLASLE